jgi:hypothetical protein
VLWNAPEEIASAVHAAVDHISAEVLATEFKRDGALKLGDGDLGFNATLLKS